MRAARNGFSISDLRFASVGVDFEFAEHAVANDFQMQLAHSGNDGLAGVLVRVDTECWIFFGESLGGSGGPQRDFSASWMGAGAFAAAWGLPDPAQWYTFGGKHTAVVQFGFGDGSVRSIRKGCCSSFFSNDWYAFQRASGIQDGQVVDFGQLGQ